MPVVKGGSHRYPQEINIWLYMWPWLLLLSTRVFSAFTSWIIYSFRKGIKTLFLHTPTSFPSQNQPWRRWDVFNTLSVFTNAFFFPLLMMGQMVGSACLSTAEFQWLRVGALERLPKFTNQFLILGKLLTLSEGQLFLHQRGMPLMSTTRGLRGPTELICVNPFPWLPYPFFKTQFRNNLLHEAFLDTPTLPCMVASSTSTT